VIRRSCSCDAGIAVEGDKAQQLADEFVDRHEALGHTIVQRPWSQEGRAPRKPRSGKALETTPERDPLIIGNSMEVVQVKPGVL
jgi:hypothetical protein